MNRLLLKLLVKNSEQTDNPKVRSTIGKLGGATGIVCNTLLFVSKLIVGFVLGSVSIIADALNNLTDTTSSFITFFGFRLASRPADKDHPYGHARYEYISGLFVAVIILVIGIELIKTSIDKIINPTDVKFTLVTYVILGGSVLIKLWMTLFYAFLSKKISSSTLKASSADSRNDVITTSTIIVGGIVNQLFGLNVDGYIGLATALFIVYSGIMVARDTISPLIGKRADENTVNKLNDLILSHEGILGIHDLLIHDYGPGCCYASVHTEIDAETDPLVCHDIIDHVEQDALEQLNINLVIHYDPVVTRDEEWNNLRILLDEIIKDINCTYSIHDFRIAKGSEQTKLIFDLAIPYNCNYEPHLIKQRIDGKLAVMGKNYATVIRFDRS